LLQEIPGIPGIPLKPGEIVMLGAVKEVLEKMIAEGKIELTDD
jgi:hypothetical protein